MAAAGDVVGRITNGVIMLDGIAELLTGAIDLPPAACCDQRAGDTRVRGRELYRRSGC